MAPLTFFVLATPIADLRVCVSATSAQVTDNIVTLAAGMPLGGALEGPLWSSGFL